MKSFWFYILEDTKTVELDFSLDTHLLTAMTLFWDLFSVLSSATQLHNFMEEHFCWKNKMASVAGICQNISRKITKLWKLPHTVKSKLISSNKIVLGSWSQCLSSSARRGQEPRFSNNICWLCPGRKINYKNTSPTTVQDLVIVTETSNYRKIIIMNTVH